MRTDEEGAIDREFKVAALFVGLGMVLIVAADLARIPDAETYKIEFALELTASLATIAAFAFVTLRHCFSRLSLRLLAAAVALIATGNAIELPAVKTAIEGLLGESAFWPVKDALMHSAIFAVLFSVLALLLASNRQNTQLRAEVEKRAKVEAALNRMVGGVAGATGDAFFDSLAQHLAAAFESRYAIITSGLDQRPGQAEVIALWDGERVVKGESVEVSGQPWEKPHRAQFCHWESGVGEHFPGSALVRDLGLESYLGAPLLDSAGAVCGHISVGDVRPLAPEPWFEPVLKSFAARAGGELLRQRTEVAHERMLRRIQQAQKTESLGVLAGGVAHDFNNLLTAIMTHSGLAQIDLPRESPAAEHLRKLESATEQAADLCRQMLAYSGRGHFIVGPVDLNSLVEDMASLLASSVAKGAVIDLQPAPALPPIRADATQVRQIVMNLATNASEALPAEGGRITVRTRSVEANANDLTTTFIEDQPPPGSYVCLEVEDSGCGMDEETRARVFDPFFTTKFAGRGLGMAAVLGIVRGHHATIQVDSSPGKGSIFRVLFPTLADGAAVGKDTLQRAGSAAGAAGIETGGRRDGAVARGAYTVLVIDDEAIVRNVARDVLGQGGFRVLTAADGSEGVAMAEREDGQLDAILLDMTMPVMDGLATFEELSRRGIRTPVLLTSGYDQQETMARFPSDGPAGFIQKPYRPNQLVEAIDKILSAKKGIAAPTGEEAGTAERLQP